MEDTEFFWTRFIESVEGITEHNPHQVHLLREQIMANAKVVFPNGLVDLVTGEDERGGASYAYIIRRLENADRPFDVLLAVRGNLGSCPLLGMLRFLQQEVAPVMHSLFDRVGVDWD